MVQVVCIYMPMENFKGPRNHLLWPFSVLRMFFLSFFLSFRVLATFLMLHLVCSSTKAEQVKSNMTCLTRRPMHVAPFDSWLTFPVLL